MARGVLKFSGVPGFTNAHSFGTALRLPLHPGAEFSLLNQEF